MLCAPIFSAVPDCLPPPAHPGQDDGSILGLPVAGDFMATLRFTLLAKHQFDQAGLCVRVGPEHWCKAVGDVHLCNLGHPAVAAMAVSRPRTVDRRI